MANATTETFFMPEQSARLDRIEDDVAEIRDLLERIVEDAEGRGVESA